MEVKVPEVIYTTSTDLETVHFALQNVKARSSHDYNAFDFSKADKQAFINKLAQFLRLSTAYGRPSDDTMNSYMSHIKEFGRWCFDKGIDPFTALPRHIIGYRGYLYEVKNRSSRTVSAKLSAVRRFYESALHHDLIQKNPAADIFAETKDDDDFGTRFLTAGHLEYLFRIIPNEGEENLRAKAMIALMGLEGLRRVEIHRANEEDMDWQHGILIVHGKGKRRRAYPREDTLVILKRYLDVRYAIRTDNGQTPMFTSVSNNSRGRRLHRDGVHDNIKKWFSKADIEPDLSCHLLRHTAGALLYQETKDLRAVQETLGHADPKTTAKYAHIQDRMVNRYTKAIPVKIL